MKLKEELGELLVAVSRYQFDRCGKVPVLREAADVYIMVGQIVDILDDEDLFIKYVNQKLNRTFLRITRERREAAESNEL